jgi:hypothetical protein
VQLHASSLGSGLLISGTPEYVLQDWAFRFTPDASVSSSRAALALGTLQLDVDVTEARCLYAWGYSPFTRWVLEELKVPEAAPGKVVAGSIVFEQGVGVAVGGQDEWLETFDPEAGWFCSRRIEGRAEAAVMIASGTIMALCTGTLQAVCIKPMNHRVLPRAIRDRR